MQPSKAWKRGHGSDHVGNIVDTSQKGLSRLVSVEVPLAGTVAEDVFEAKAGRNTHGKESEGDESDHRPTRVWGGDTDPSLWTEDPIFPSPKLDEVGLPLPHSSPI